MAKYVARVRKDANAYRYFYSPAEYQAYIKAKGKTIGDKVTDAVSSAKDKVHKYIYNKNASKKLNEMGKAHEIDERGKQNAQKKVTPSDHRNIYDSGSTVNRRTLEAVYGGTVKKQNGKYVHIDTRKSTTPSKEDYNSPNVGKMQDAIYKTLNNQQRVTTRKEEHKEHVTKRMNEAADKRAYSNGYTKVNDPKLPNANVLRYTESGPAADAKAKTKEVESKVKAKREQRKEDVTKRMNEAANKRAYSSGYVKVDDPNLPNVNVRRFTESGPAADAKAKANELEAKRTLKKKYVK